MYANLQAALVVTRREVRDQFRDWRIGLPLLMLALVLPLVIQFAEGQVSGFAGRFGVILAAPWQARPSPDDMLYPRKRSRPSLCRMAACQDWKPCASSSRVRCRWYGCTTCEPSCWQP